ncbi:MAG TPA: nitrophenyl compound nitroreductase subunit ArsF family protein [Dehalococcoidales bacterium]|nr:nitrophenyl compound nitroreductase subunit ArsF family protein [Dehalococcoidales bacterium]
MKKATNYFLLAVVLTLFSLAVSCQPATNKPTEDREPAFELNVDILGRTHTTSLDDEGGLIVSAVLASSDGKVVLSIDRGTRLLDKDKKPLLSICMKSELETLAQPEDAHIIGAVYSLEPKDATFNLPLKLTLSYDPQDLPEGISESDISILPNYESSGWGESYYKNVDAERHRVTTQISRFARFAVVVPVVAASQAPTMNITPAIEVPATAATPTVKVDLLYFHRSQRCTKCLCFEERVSYVVSEYFQDEINSGQLTFRILNIGDKENVALVKKYGAVSSQLFINTIVDGVENIRDVQDIWSWDCTSKTNRFEDEVKNTIEISLRGGQ